MARPAFKITDQVLADVEKHAALGLTMSQICLCIGCCETTLYKKKRQFTQFTQAIKKGQAKSLATISSVLYNKAKNGDNTCIIFFLKCRGGDQWNENSKDKGEEDTAITEITYTVIK